MTKDYFYSLINSILFFILGLIIFISPDTVIKTITYVLGSFLILTGIYNLLIFYHVFKKLNIKENDKLESGIVLIILGIVSIICASLIDIVLRLIVGVWLIYNGVLKIFEAIKFNFSNTYLITKIIIGSILIILGLYMILVSNLVLSVIGIIIMFYVVIDIIEKISLPKK